MKKAYPRRFIEFKNGGDENMFSERFNNSKLIILKYLFLTLLVLYFFNLSYNYEAVVKALKFQKLLPYCISSGIFILVYSFLLIKRLGLFETCLHEITHAFFALLTFNKVEAFSCSFSNGVTVYRGKSNLLINLSPYFFPILTFFIILISLFVKKSALLFFHHAISISYIYFLISAIKQFSFQQTDIQKSGLLFSAIVVGILNILMLLGIIFYLQNDINDYWNFLYRFFIWRG